MRRETSRYDAREAGTLGFGPETLGFGPRTAANLETAALYEEALRRGEARLARSGALSVETGAHTGRSPHDKFIVRDALTEEHVWWDNCRAMAPEHFGRLLTDMSQAAGARHLFTQDLHAGADPAHRLRVRVASEQAWRALFIRTMLIRPAGAELAGFRPDLAILDLPSFRADPARHGCRSETVIALDFTRRMVLIAGTGYAGEIKKAVFSYLNFILPARGVMPMHCAANVGAAGDTAIFFGLSGTGKTTLSADPSRSLVGDDEHGWARRACSISRAAATPRRSASRARRSRRSTPPASVSAR